jgi:RNA-directed DNA polymerase
MEKIPKSKEGWNVIQWVTVEGYVRKLQERIYLASKEGKTKTVRDLQKCLVNSYNAKLVATRRVTQDNKGKKTDGVDVIKMLNPQQLFEYVNKIKICGKASPLRQVWILKPGKQEKRPLAIPTMTDRINQALFKLALEPEWEAKFEPNSYGFRPGRGCHDAIKQIYLSINKKPKYVLDAHIRKCFDRIDHSKLLAKVGFGKGKFHNQIKAWLVSGVIDQDVFQDNEEKGRVISPLLANIALHGMETMLKDLMKSIPLRTPTGTSMGTRDKQRSLSVIRYADDFVVMHYDKQVVLKCKEAIQTWLKEIGLELSEETTRITHTLELTEEEK